MVKLLILVSGIVLLSGCCELFGICTSVSLHSSNPASDDVGKLGTSGQWMFGAASAPDASSRSCVSSTSS